MTNLSGWGRTVSAGPRHAPVAPLAVVLTLAVASIAHAAAAPSRIVAIGDVHGDADALVALLEHTGLLDDARRWKGGTATLVQTGDFLDRGVQVREVLGLLMALEQQARAAGGDAIVLMGNHEAMNALGDLRDVSPQAYAAFADAQSEAHRSEAFAVHAALADARRAALAKTDPTLHVTAAYAPLDREAWMTAHPPGMLEYLEAFGPDGVYGQWLRARPVSTRLGDTLFVHGGWNPDVSPKVPDAATDQARQELARWDRMRAWMIDQGIATPSFAFEELASAGQAELRRVATEARTSDQGAVPPGALPPAVVRHPLAELLGLNAWSLLNGDGPLWFRGFATWSSEEGRMRVDALQRRYGTLRFVVGHTPPKPPRQMARFDHRAFLIDTGISSVYRSQGGRPSALEIRNGVYTAVYLDDRTVLFDPMGSVVRE